jgi:hypothetical protein
MLKEQVLGRTGNDLKIFRHVRIEQVHECLHALSHVESVTTSWIVVFRKGPWGVSAAGAKKIFDSVLDDVEVTARLTGCIRQLPDTKDRAPSRIEFH